MIHSIRFTCILDRFRKCGLAQTANYLHAYL